MKYMLLLPVLFLSLRSLAQNKVSFQSSKFPLQTAVDPQFLAKMKTDAGVVMQDPYMKQVEELAAAGDPEAIYLIALRYDNMGQASGSPQDAAKALEYYQKAAGLKMAEAEMQLFAAYAYGFLGVKPNEAKAMEYADRVILHADDSLKALCYFTCASIYMAKNNHAANLKARSYLEKLLLIDPANNYALDAMAGFYDKEKNYKKAAELMLRSSNDQSKLTVAAWLMHGKKIPKDKAKALRLVREVLANFEKAGYNMENMSSYMGALNPVLMLNHFYLCDKAITRQELGSWYVSSYSCHEGDQFGH